MSNQCIVLHSRTAVGPEELQLIPKNRSKSLWLSIDEVHTWWSFYRERYKILFHANLTKSDHFWQFLASTHGDTCSALHTVTKQRDVLNKSIALRKLNTDSVHSAVLGYMCSNCPVAKLFLDEVCDLDEAISHGSSVYSAQTENGAEELLPVLSSLKKDVQKRDDQYQEKFKKVSLLLKEYFPNIHFQEKLSHFLSYLQAMEKMCFLVLLARKEKWPRFEEEVKDKKHFPDWAEVLINNTLVKQARHKSAGYSFVNEWLKTHDESLLKKRLVRLRLQSVEEYLKPKLDQFRQQPFENGITEVLRLKSCRKNVQEQVTRMVEIMTTCLNEELSKLTPLSEDELQSKEKRALDDVERSLCSCKAEHTDNPPCLTITDVLMKQQQSGFNIARHFKLSHTKFQLHYEEEQHSRQNFAESLYFHDFKPTAPQANGWQQLADIRLHRKLLWLPEKSQLLKLWLLKSGQVLFVLNTAGTIQVGLVETPLSNYNWKFLPLERVVKDTADQICYNEEKNTVAILSETTRMFHVFQFDPQWKNLAKLLCHGKVSYRKRMHMLLSQNKLLFLYADGHLESWNIIRKSQTRALLPLSTKDGSLITHALLSPDGYFIFALTIPKPQQQSPMLQKHQGGSRQVSTNQKQTEGSIPNQTVGIGSILVYSVTRLKLVTPSLSDHEYPDLTLSMQQSLSFVQLGNDPYLVALDKEHSQRSLLMCKVCITSPSTFSKLQFEKKTSMGPESSHDHSTVCSNYLDYLSLIYTQFCITDSLKSVRTSLFLICLVDLDPTAVRELSQKGRRYISDSFYQFWNARGKQTSSFTLKSRFESLSSSCQKHLGPEFDRLPQWSAGKWIRHLICLVPIQICRTESNRLVIQPDGHLSDFEIPATSMETIDVQKKISFGLFDSILCSWSGPVKVVSSMGEQSTGKSFLLNHLTGSMFDIAVDRCTNGIWMAVRVNDHCLTVVLDFEGIVSDRRSTQEDTLLSITQAAISGLTLFRTLYNAKASMPVFFERCYLATNLIKGPAAERFFNGYLCVCARDVQQCDITEVQEYYEKFFFLEERQRDASHFLETMYGRKLEIKSFPPPSDPAFYDLLDNICSQHLSKQETEPFYPNGRKFLHDFTILLAQVSCLDWTNFEQGAVRKATRDLCYHMVDAISTGQQRSESGEICNLQLWTNGKKVEEDALCWEDGSSITGLPDAGTQLCSMNCHDDETMAPVLLPLQLEESCRLMTILLVLYEGKHGKRHKGGPEKLDGWISGFQKLLEKVCKRRTERVWKWMESYSVVLIHSPTFSNYQQSVEERLEELQQRWTSQCKSKCKHACAHRCLRPAHPDNDHDCLGDHKCFQQCNKSTHRGGSVNGEQKRCDKQYGHTDDDQHECKTCLNTCTKTCGYPECTQTCSKLNKHTDSEDHPHRCRRHAHSCGEKCSGPDCDQMCSLGLSPHPHIAGRHECTDRQCRKTCDLCDQRCSTKDHFHGVRTPVEKHLCGSKHRCKERCSLAGHCDIRQTTSMEPTSVEQSNGNITVVNKHVSVQRGVSKPCGVWIKANETCHGGDHVCDPSHVHVCGEECRGCGYLCDLPHGHEERHETTHGNMRLAVTANFSDSFTFNGRTYRPGNPGNLEMCAFYCEGKGRGHMHLINRSARSAAEGQYSIRPANEWDINAISQSGTHVSPPDNGHGFNNHYDMVSHDAYWAELGFKDPCEGSNEFSFCGARCPVTEHESVKFCEEAVCHNPVQYSEIPIDPGGAGFIYNGHYFRCQHPPLKPLHHIFVVDVSESMKVEDDLLQAPEDRALGRRANKTRLRFVLDACQKYVSDRKKSRCGEFDTVSLIKFGDGAEITEILNQPLNPVKFRDECLSLKPVEKDTDYKAALEKTFDAISYGEQHDDTGGHRRCVVIFLTDGRKFIMFPAKSKLEKSLRDRERKPKVRFHFYEFGSGLEGSGLFFSGVRPLYETAKKFTDLENDPFATCSMKSVKDDSQLENELLEELSDTSNPLIAEFVVSL